MLNVKPKIIALQEVKPKNFKFVRTMVEYNLKGYEFIHRNLEKQDNGRGLLVYISSDIHHTPVTFEQEFTEYLSVKVNLSDKNTLPFSSIYRSPNSSTEDNKDLCKLLKEMCASNYSHYITVGDFNLPDIDWEYCTTSTETSDINFEFIECLRDCFWHQHILEPTRARGDANPSILDLIMSNEEGMVSDILIQNPIGKSDHSTISFTFQGHSKSKSTNLKRDYNMADYKSMKAMLNINWEELLKNKCVEEQWTLLSSKINKVIEKYVPIKKVSNNFSSKDNVPVSHKLKRLIRRKEKLWKKFRISGDRPAHEDYKKVRNQVRRLSRKAVKLKEKDIAMSAKENPKKFWSYVKSKLKTKTSIADLYTNESKTTLTDSDEAKANVLGKFFSSVFTIEPEDLLPELI